VTDVSADIIVVGGGVAGWTAATVASESGARVVVVEKSAHGPSGGNGLLSAGVFHAAYHAPETPPAQLQEAILAKVDGAAREDVVRAWSENVGRARDFLGSHGGSFYRPFPDDEHMEHMSNVLEPFRIYAAPTTRDLVRAEAWRGMGPHVLFTAMHDGLLTRGGRFIGGARARRLLMDGPRVCGVGIELAGGQRRTIAGRAVILADGGFQANADLVNRYITTTYRLRGSVNDEGDAMQMALEVGAQLTNMGAFYGHVVHRDSLENDRLWPDPSPEGIVDLSIVVEGSGRRIVDEWRGDTPWAPFSDKVAGAVAHSSTPGNCWLVFDERLWETVGREGLGATPNPTLVEEGAEIVRADTVEALAAAARLPPEALAVTVSGFNAYCTSGASVDPPRSGRPEPLCSPFMGIPIVAGITFAMGGVVVDESARVLAEGDVPIAGLYAAGGTMGGLQGGPRNGYAGGWSEASTFGLLAGEHAARWLQRAGA
jgi:fumarate reductase flavoprotein subunit